MLPFKRANVLGWSVYPVCAMVGMELGKVITAPT